MVYAYIRVSTVKQDFTGQFYSIQQYADLHGLKIDEVIEEKVSGKVPRDKRDLGRLVAKLVEGDVLLTPELSRLGRSTGDTVTTVELLKKKNVTVHLIKENLISGTPNYDFMTTIYAGLASMERQRISERTKEALQAKIAAGVRIGHYKGYKCSNVKLTPYQAEILTALGNGCSIKYIAEKYGVKWSTARDFIRDRLHYDLNKIKTVTDYRSYMAKKQV